LSKNPFPEDRNINNYSLTKLRSYNQKVSEPVDTKQWVSKSRKNSKKSEVELQSLTMDAPGRAYREIYPDSIDVLSQPCYRSKDSRVPLVDLTN